MPTSDPLEMLVAKSDRAMAYQGSRRPAREEIRGGSLPAGHVETKGEDPHEVDPEDKPVKPVGAQCHGVSR